MMAHRLGWLAGIMAAFLLHLVPSAGLRAADSRPTRPNIIFILADDLGIHDLGCYGRADHHTPHLDQLAKTGTRFTAAYAAASICSPTRAALMTGLAPARLHLTTFLPGRANAASQKLLHPTIATGLPANIPTLPRTLKDAGYATACIGKWHLGGAGSQPKDHGFDLYFPGKGRTVPSATEGSKGEAGLTARAIQFVEQNHKQPFFLYLAHHSPHIPYAASAESLARHAKAHEPAYAAVIESLDSTIGKLLARLDELQLAESTLVIFTSDNGGLSVPELKHQRITHCSPYRAGKGFLYEGGIRVPLIVRQPGTVPAGRVVDTPVLTTDWLSTFATRIGVKPPARQDGINLVPLLHGTGTIAERPLFWHQPHYVNQGGRPSGAVRVGSWKLIHYYDTDTVELYDLQADPAEERDRSRAEPARTAAMKRQLADWLQAVDAQTMKPNPDFDPALFRKLYVEIDPSRYNSARADSTLFERMQIWRTLMDAVVRPPNPGP